MEQERTTTFRIGGMSCPSCEKRIQKGLEALEGVSRVQVSYHKGAARVDYDPARLCPGRIAQAVEELGYRMEGETGRGAGLARAALLVLAMLLLLRLFGLPGALGDFPQAREGMGYGMLFVVGLLTSVHCVAMCGGISLTQCMGAKQEGAPRPFGALGPSGLYNLGRVLSYTLVGAGVGALGSVISFSGAARGAVQIAAGVFMVVMGLNMLGILPGLARFVPHLPGALGEWVQNAKSRGGSPFLVGLLNGLMPCGPLQAMQLYALSTGSPVKGALSMLAFSLGTVPLLFGFGAVSTLLSKRFTGRVMTAGASLVVVLGISMLSGGLSLSGFAAPLPAGGAGGEAAQAEAGGDVQIVRTTLDAGRYAPISVEVGVPVEWTIDVAEGTLSGCNYRLLIPAYGIDLTLAYGENTVAFTPTETGVFPYSCWMGMIRSSITVTGADGALPEEALQDTVPELPILGGRVCC